MVEPNRPTPKGRLPIGLMVVGSEMASFTVIGVLIDWASGTLPGFTIGLTLLGVVFAFVQLKKMAKVLAESDRKPEPPAGSGP